MALAPLVALVAGAGIATGVLRGFSDGPPSGTAEAAQTRDSGSLLLTAADHVGRPVGEVAEELTALGLVVELKAEITAAVARDQVTGLSPTGRQLRAGDVVVVRYAVPPPRSSTGVGGPATPDDAYPTDDAPAPAEVTEVGTVAGTGDPEPTLQAGLTTAPSAPTTGTSGPGSTSGTATTTPTTPTTPPTTSDTPPSSSTPPPTTTTSAPPTTTGATDPVTP